MKAHWILTCATAMAAPSMAYAQTASQPVQNPAQAAAQQSGDYQGIDEVIVTAQKREENLQNVPISIAALSAETLETKGISSVTDFQRVPVTGLTAQQFSGNRNLMVLDLRGITTPDPGQGTVEPGVAVYLDDVYLSRAQAIGQELADPERIEVLKGPQGTLFGRNAEGGAIRIVSKKPTGKLGGDAKVTVGDFGRLAFETHINLPSIAGIAIKVDAIHRELDGYVKNGTARLANLSQQENFGMEDINGFRVSARWKPIAALTLDYAFDYIDSDTTNDYARLTRPGPNDNGFALFVRPPAAGSPGNLNQPRPDDPRPGEQVSQSWTGLWHGVNKDRTRAHTLTAALDASDWLTVKTISAWRNLNASNFGSLAGAPDFTLMPAGTTLAAFRPLYADQPLGLPSTTPVYAISGIVPIVSNIQSRAFSQELQFIGTFDTFEFVLGGYYYNERTRDDRLNSGPFSLVYTSATAAPIAVNPYVSAALPGNGATIVGAQSKSKAGFAQATWSPGFADGALRLTAGVRYTDDTKTFFRDQLNGNMSTTQTGTTPTPLTGVLVPVIPRTTGRTFSTKRWDPSFTLAYDVAAGVNVYARYAQAYKSGGVGVRSSGFLPFGEEVAKAIELGFKSDLFDRRLRLNGALFQNRISDRQIVIQPQPASAPSITDIANAPGVTRVRGAELDLTFAPNRNLTISLSGGYTEYRIPSETLALNNGLTPAQQSLFFVQNTPKWTGTGAIDYRFPEFENGSFIAAHLDYAIASDTFGQARYSPTGFVWPLERHQGNARITLDEIPLGEHKAKLSFFVNNIANEIFPVFSAPSGYYFANAPRTVGIDLGFKF